MQIKPLDADQPGTAEPTAVAEQPRKLTRKEKRALNRAKLEAIQAAAFIADRLRKGEAPTEAFMAKADPDVLRAELVKIAPSAPQDAASQRQLATVAAAVGAGEQVAAAVATAAKKQLGRPEEYTQEEGDRLCAWIASGKSLRSYQQTTGRAIATVYSWMRKHPTFLARYTVAREDRADTLADEIQEIADEAAVAPSIEAVAAAKLRIETRKWIAEKLNPKRYGQHLNVDRTERVSFHLGIAPRPVQGRSDDVVDVTPSQPRQVVDSTKASS